MRPIIATLRAQICKHLASCYDVDQRDILPLLESNIEHWGKLQWLEGGDMMHASEIGQHGTRDMTYVKFNGHYGQLRLLFVIKLEPSNVLQTTTTKFHLLAAVSRSIMSQKNRLGMPHTKGKSRAVEIIDAEDLDFVVGRVPDRGEFVLTERIGCNNVLQAREDPVEAVAPRNHRQRRI
ncbi:hypothetical protein B0H13DRAFT_2380359 [Mycena leptocephala]|nr:hypothetical protein B0H13DRAFT_2380359 [Mycena leptocephala]